jgi:hypothetical protein
MPLKSLAKVVLFLTMNYKHKTGPNGGLLQIARDHCPPAHGSGIQLSTMNKEKIALYIATHPDGRDWILRTHGYTVASVGLDEIAHITNSLSEVRVRVIKAHMIAQLNCPFCT